MIGAIGCFLREGLGRLKDGQRGKCRGASDSQEGKLRQSLMLSEDQKESKGEPCSKPIQPQSWKLE